MRMGWLMMLFLVIAATMPPIAIEQAQAQEAEQKQTETCPLPEGWDPAEDLPRILAEHKEWAEKWNANNRSLEWESKFSQGKGNLCNANLVKVNFTNAVLDRINLNGAILDEANLT